MKLLRLSLAAAALVAALAACDASRIAAPRTPPAGPASDDSPSPETTSDYVPPPLPFPLPTDTVNRGQTVGSGG